jgi:hypothetical protein
MFLEMNLQSLKRRENFSLHPTLSDVDAYENIKIFLYLYVTWSRDSAVGIATRYGLDGRGFGVRVTVGSRIFFSPRRPDRPWGPASLLTNRYGE